MDRSREIELATLAVLDTLPPAERVAFLLHDMFDMPFDEIAEILGCSPLAARRSVSRARNVIRNVKSGLNARY